MNENLFNKEFDYLSFDIDSIFDYFNKKFFCNSKFELNISEETNLMSELTSNDNINTNKKKKNLVQKFFFLFDSSNKNSYPSKFQSFSFIKDNITLLKSNKLIDLIDFDKTNSLNHSQNVLEHNHEMKSILPSLNQLKEMQNVKEITLNLSLVEQLDTINTELSNYEIQRQKFMTIINNIENNKEEFFPNESIHLFKEYIVLIDHLIDELKSRAENVKFDINNNLYNKNTPGDN
jgi:exonuclease VII small subunit